MRNKPQRFVLLTRHPRRRVATLFVLLGVAVGLSSGCADSTSSPDSEDSPAAAADSSGGVDRHVETAPPSPGKIESVPLEPRDVGAGEPLFATLDPRQVGIDFFHKKDPARVVSPELIIGSGVAMGDYDADGRVDVFLASSTSGGRLYRNLGEFRFQDVTDAAGIAQSPDRWTTGATFVDVDNDGDLDLFVCGNACPNHLYVNQGDGTFIERAGEYGLDVTRASVMMAFADYDRDGDLDAYLVTNHTPPSGETRYRLEYDQSGAPRVPERFLEYRDAVRIGSNSYKIVDAGQYDYLFENHGDSTFGDVTESAGIRGRQTGIRGNDRGLSGTWWDYNADGWPDLYVANDFYGSDRLYRNNGDGTFTDVIATAVPHTPWFSMGSDFGDINNDGRLDFMGTDMSERTEYRQKMTRRNSQTSGWFLDWAVPRQYARNAVYLNAGAERFHEVAYLTGLVSTNWTWSVRFADLDLDGRQDAHITNGMSLDLDNNDLKNAAAKVGPVDSEVYRRFWAEQPMLRQRNFAFRNLGNLKFENVSRAWGLDHLGVSFGAALGDLDSDGDLDLVVNNFDDFATVARNEGGAGHAIRIRLVGSLSNRWGIGATVRLRASGESQVGYLTLSRGFMSASDPTLHFGLGDADRVDELTVEWPSGRRQAFTDLAADRFYTITEPTSPSPNAIEKPSDEPPPLFARSTALEPPAHREEPFDDFAREPLLPFRLSQLGPGVAVGDVHGDGSDDLFLGGTKAAWGKLIVQTTERTWTAAPDLFPPWTDDGGREQLGVLLFDADGDGDLDLYAVSGSNECEPGDELLRDRLYWNDGQGTFTAAAAEQLPDFRDSGSVAAAADYDRDGDLDLYVGGRCLPGRFPEVPSSRLLNNDGGRFRDATADDAPDVLHSGLVTSALWSDVNDDGWIDLLVTHEWGPVKLFVNEQGFLRDATAASGLAEWQGWWNGIAGRDLDGDGDVDYVVTNLGRNTVYRVTAERPAVLCYGDFNGDGKPVLVEGKYDEKGRLVPAGSKQEVERAVPAVEFAFPTFDEFASATLAEVLGGEALENALQLSANTVDSVVLRNDGQGHFNAEPLPLVAQLAPGFGVVLSDFDADGLADIYLVQNSYAPRREIGRMDGGASALLLGQPDGRFRPVPYQESGLVVAGDAKSAAVCDVNGDHWPDLVVGVNDGPAVAFEHQQVPGRRLLSVRLRGRPGNPTGVGARVTVHGKSGARQTAEVAAGGGYLSQQSPTLYFGIGAEDEVSAIEIRWPDGRTARVTPEAGELAVVIEQPDDPKP